MRVLVKATHGAMHSEHIDRRLRPHRSLQRARLLPRRAGPFLAVHPHEPGLCGNRRREREGFLQ